PFLLNDKPSLSKKGYLRIGDRDRPFWKVADSRVYANFDDNSKIHGTATYITKNSLIVDIDYDHGKLLTDLSNVAIYSLQRDKEGSTFYKGAVNGALQPHGEGIRYITNSRGDAQFKTEWTDGKQTDDADGTVMQQTGEYMVTYFLPNSKGINFTNSWGILNAPNGINAQAVKTTFYESYPDKPVYQTVGGFDHDMPIGEHQLAVYQNGSWQAQSPIIYSQKTYISDEDKYYSYLINGPNLLQVTTPEVHEKIQIVKRREAEVLAQKNLVDRVNARIDSAYRAENGFYTTINYNGAIYPTVGTGLTTGQHDLFFVNAGPACNLQVKCTFKEKGSYKVLAEKTFTVPLKDGRNGLHGYTLEVNLDGGSYTRKLEVQISGIPENANIRVISAYTGRLIDKKEKDA
ncbi:MAG: hypothetical protein AAFO69_21585, partial [Bacteroidota bacterium]